MNYYAGILLLSLISTHTSLQIKTETTFIEIGPQQNSLKTKAFNILKNKCNICHATKRRIQLFTLNNMDSLKAEINTQVFIKRKMPKGKRNQLSKQEEMNLKNWLSGLN